MGVKYILLLFALTFFYQITEGQPVSEIESTILKCTERIDYWTSNPNIDSEDSTATISKFLLDYLKVALENQPTSINSSFKKIQKGEMNILTSDDSNVRIYCWDVGGMHTARSTDALIQYRTPKGIKVEILNDDTKSVEGDVLTGTYYRELYTYQTKSIGTIYVEIDIVVAWNTGGEYNVSAFAIRNNKLVWNIPFFKTSTKTKSSISYGYDLSLDKNSNFDFEDIKIRMSEDRKTLSIPLITNDNKITGKYLVYKFDGNEFVFDRESSK